MDCGVAVLNNELTSATPRKDSFHRLIICANARNYYKEYKDEIFELLDHVRSCDMQEVFDAIISHNYEVCIDIANEDLMNEDEVLWNGKITFSDAVDEYSSELYQDIVMNEQEEDRFFWVSSVLTEGKICTEVTIDAYTKISFNNCQNRLLKELADPISKEVWELGYEGYLESGDAIILPENDLAERMVMLSE